MTVSFLVTILDLLLLIFRTDFALELIKKTLIAETTSKAVAAGIKAGFDTAYAGTTWHCIVGAHFGVSIRHATNHLIFVNATEVC